MKSAVIGLCDDGALFRKNPQPVIMITQRKLPVFWQLFL